MATKECGPWDEGLDCTFNLNKFHSALMVVWLATLCVLLRWRHKLLAAGAAPARAGAPAAAGSRVGRSLLWASASALLCGLDSLLSLAWARAVLGGGAYRTGTLSLLGTALLAAAWRLFGALWADVADGVNEKHRVHRVRGRGLAMARIVRRGHSLVALCHLPVAVVAAVSLYPVGLALKRTLMVLVGWCFVAACVIGSALALAAWLCANRTLAGVAEANGLRASAGVRLKAQCIFNALWFTTGLLFLRREFIERGDFRGTVYVLAFVMLWVLHAQLLACFLACDVEDPLRVGRVDKAERLPHQPSESLGDSRELLERAGETGSRSISEAQTSPCSSGF